MADVIIDESNLYAIADSIRAKLGVQTTYKPSQMADAIDSISGGGSTLGTKTITANGTYDAEDDELDGYSEVTVNVSGITPTGTMNITANGTYDVTQYASADVAVPTGSTPVINSLSVTENGTYTAPTGVDGYSPITVNVSGSTGYSIDDIFSGEEPSGDIVINATTFRGYAFANRTGITSVTIVNDLTFVSNQNLPFTGCTGITSISAPKLTKGRNKLFCGCTNLQTVDLPKLTTISGDQFIESSKVVYLVFPSFSGDINSNALRFNTLLQAIDVAACTSIYGTAFSGCSVFDTFIIRGDSVPTLSNINSFTNTPFASGKTGGTIYVPSAMITSYQSATNWSTILGYANNNIVAIEGSEYETKYVDGSTIPTT